MRAYRRLPERAPAAKADVVETPSGAAPPGTGIPGQRTPSERARLAALARWEKYRAGEDQPKRGRGRTAKPRPTPEEQEAQRRQEAQRNRTAALSSQGVDAIAQAAMEALAMGRDPEDASGLLAAGLAERGADGIIRLTTEGRQAYNAAGRGEAGLVREILGKAKDRLVQAEAAEALARKKEEERAQKEEARSGRKRGGGGGGGGGRASEEEKEQRREEARRKREEERQAAIVERRAATAEAVGLEAEALAALVRARDEGGVDDDDLRALGFLNDDGEATAEGRRALAALERGDRGAYRAALQQARRRMARAKNEQEEDAMSESLKALDFATRLDLVRMAVLDALHRAEAYDPDDAALPGMALVHARDDDGDHDDIAIYVYDEFAVACLGAGEDVKIPYTVEDGDVVVAEPDEWRLIEWEPVERGAYRSATEDAAPVAIKALDDALLAVDGGAVKALSDGRTSGYLIRFGDAASSGDLSPYRDIFTRATDYGSAKTSDVYVHHRLLPGLGKRQLKHQATLRLDEVGVFIEHLLDLRDPFERALYELAQKGKLGWSSGTAAHLVERKALGDGRHIVEKWPLGLDASYTPTPAGGLDMNVALKSLLSDPQVAAGSGAQDAEASEASDAARRRRLLLELDLLDLEDTHV